MPRLLALLLALQDLLLHLLDLLRSASRPAGRHDRSTRLLLWRLIRIDVFVVGIGWGGIAGRRCAPGVAGTEYSLARSSLALISDEEDVVTGALQKLAEHVAR